MGVKHEAKPRENRMRGKGEPHTKVEQMISTIEQGEEKVENAARREAWRMVSRLKEDSESRNSVLFDNERGLEEGRPKATGKKVGLLSAFAGIGSCEIAAAKLGVAVIGYWEIDTAACRALEIQSPTATSLGDIRVDNMRLVRELMASYERVIMIAGVPCQSFSSAGNRSFNGELLDTTIRVAVEAQVNFLLVECVPDLVRKDELFDQETAEWRALDAGPEGPVREGWHRECSKAIKKAATGGLKLIATRVLKDWEHDGATTRERVFLFFERPVSGRLCAPLCVARCMKGGECRDIAGALSPVELVSDKTVVEGSFIRSGVETNTEGEARLAGWLLLSLPLVVGAVVCTQKWRGKLKDGNRMRISGEMVGGSFLCVDREGAEKWVAQTNLVWMLVSEPLRPLLRTGMRVGMAGDLKWYKLLEIASEGQGKVSYKNKAKVQYRSIVLAQVAVAKIERLAVLDPKGLGFCLRRDGDMPQGNSFLILDARFDVPVVRRLMGVEAWKLHNLSPELLLKLFNKGMVDENFGKLSGNTIPQGLANAVVGAIVSRGEVEDMAETLTAAGMPMTAPEAKGNGLKRVTLCVIKLGVMPELLCLDGSRGRLMVGADVGCEFDKGDDLLALLGSWADRLVAGTTEAFLYSQDVAYKRRDFVAVAAGAGHSLAGLLTSFASLNGFKWQGVSTIEDSAVQRLAWRAIAVAHSFMSHVRRVEDGGQWEEAQRVVLRSAQASGKLYAGLVHAALVPTSKETWSAALERDKTARGLLKAEIARRIEESECDDAKESWRVWSDCITPLAALELPAGIEAELHNFDEEALAEAPFINRCKPEKSAWLPQKQNQTPLLGDFNPRSAEELLHPWAWAAIRKWVSDEVAFLRDIRRHGADATRKTKEVLALGQEAFVKAAQGKYWDCRNIKPKLLDYSHVERSHINFDVLRTHVSVDKELESFFEFGMDYKADNVLPQIVGLPHLQSLSLGYPALIDEVRRCGEDERMRNFFSTHRSIPFLPCRFGSKGTAPKKGIDKRGRPKRRPTNEFGAPRKRKLDSGGLEVTPLNVAILEDESLVGNRDKEGGAVMEGVTKSGFVKWAHENKTRFVDVMCALAILIHGGQLMKARHSVYAMSDDCQVYFNQLRTRTSQFPLTTFVADNEDGDAVFVVEKGMTFGPSSASQIAQRVSNHLVDWFYSLMDKIEAEFVAEEARLDPGLATWLKRRHGGELWSTQGRLYAIFMYTDDPLILGVGAARMVRLVAEWDRMTGSINLLMNPEKRNLGTSLVWIGMGIITSLGLAYIPLDKAIRIVAKLQSAIAGSLMLCDYKALLGALEHVLYVSGRDRQYMMSLWRPFKGYREIDPNNFLKPSAEQSAKLRDWLKFVLSIGGVSAVRAVSETVEQRALAAGRVVYTATSDAYAEEGAEGLGFYMHGMWSFFDVPERLRGLPISTLEFLAAAWAIKTLLPIFTLAEGGAILHIRVDAIATCFSLLKKSQKSELLQTVHSELLELDEFQEGKGFLVNSHIAGLANSGADKASRPKKRDQLVIWAAALGVELTLVEAPTTWLEGVMGKLLLLHDEVGRLRRLKQDAKDRALSEEEQSLGLKVPCTRDSASETVKVSRGGPRMTAAEAFEASLEKLENMGARRKGSTTQTHASKSLEAVWQARREEPEEERDRVAGRERGFNGNAFECAWQGLTGLDKGRNAVSPIVRGWGKEVSDHGAHHPTDWLVKSIERDKSQYSIGRTPLMRTMIRKAHSLQVLGRNAKVQKANEGAWRKWLSFCDACNVKPIRDDFDANSGRDREGHAREVELLVTALMVTLPTMKGRGKVVDALPGSALNWIRAIRKVHQEMSPPIIMVPINTVDSTMRGLLKEFQLKHGVKASLAQRKEPLRNEHIKALLSLWCDVDHVGETVAKLVIGKSEAETATVRAIWQLLLETGFRLSEITDDHWDIRRASRGSVSFRIRGIILSAPTREQLMDMEEGDIVLIEPPPSKPDPTGRVWGCKPIFLPFHSTRQTCAARALRDMELALPLAAKCRRATPLFVDSRTGLSFKGNRIRTLFKASLRKFMSGEETRKYSPHSFRITLGCKLRAAGATDMEIMSLCRWLTLESLAIYCRLTPEDYGRLLNRAYKADAASIQVTNIPDIGPQE